MCTKTNEDFALAAVVPWDNHFEDMITNSTAIICYAMEVYYIYDAYGTARTVGKITNPIDKSIIREPLQ